MDEGKILTCNCEVEGSAWTTAWSGEVWGQIAMYIHLLAIYEPLQMKTPTHHHMNENRWGTSACFFNKLTDS